jgi:hypothetical protein
MSLFPTALPESKEDFDNTTEITSADQNAQGSDINAIASKVGVDNSEDTDSLDYKINHIATLSVAVGGDVNTGTDNEKYVTSKAITDSDVAFVADIPVKASGAEVNTATNDTKFVTPKAIADSTVALIADIPVAATGDEVNIGTDEAKFVTSKAIKDSAVAYTTDVPVKATGAEVSTGTVDTKFVTPKAITDSVMYNAPEGFLLNGRIAVTVASNNLTVAIKGMDGNNPSSTNPVKIRIGSTTRSITAALSATVNAGANTFNAGSSELATKEVDYFVYLGYNATDGVVVGFSRIPNATLYSDFSTTSTNEKYCAISTITNAASTDNYVNIGRFAATLSAGAGYTWSVPTYTTKNLIQKPINETRWLGWVPTYSCSGSMTYTLNTQDRAVYKISGDQIFVEFGARGTTGGSASTDISVSMPISGVASTYTIGGGANLYDGGELGGVWNGIATGSLINFSKYNKANWGIGGTKDIKANLFYAIT